MAGSLNLGQSLALDSSYPSGSRSRPSSRPTSVYGLDLSLKRDPSSSSLRLKGDGEASSEGSSYQTPSGRTKPTSLPIVQGGRGRIPIVAQNSEEESPLSPVGQPMGMARASAGPLPPISADSRDQFGSCLSLQDSQQQQHLRDEPTRGRGYVLMDDLQGTMSDNEGKQEPCLSTELFLFPVSCLRLFNPGTDCMHLIRTQFFMCLSCIYITWKELTVLNVAINLFVCMHVCLFCCSCMKFIFSIGRLLVSYCMYLFLCCNHSVTFIC